MAVGVASVVLLGTVAAVDRVGPIEAGDYVEYHFTAYDAEDRVRYTSDADVARREAAAGNPFLNPDLAHHQYRVRAAFLAGDLPPGDGPRVQPSTYLVGRHVGDHVGTPLVPAALGSTRAYELPGAFGSFPRSFDLDLERMFAGEGGAANRATMGGPEAFVLGYRMPYAQLYEAEVVARNETHARVRLDVDAGDVVYSPIFGVNFTVEDAGGDDVLMRPVLAEGDVFETRGCTLPVDVPAGRYRVASINASTLVIREAPLFAEHVLDQELRLEFTILSAQKWTTLKRMDLWAEETAARWTRGQPTISQEPTEAKP